jgi:hypothetical protein
LLGTRDLLGEDDEIQPNGKTFRKQELGEYRYRYPTIRNSWCKIVNITAQYDQFFRVASSVSIIYGMLAQLLSSVGKRIPKRLCVAR